MQYRIAKHLSHGDEIIRKEDQKVFIVNSIECYGQYKKVKISAYSIEDGLVDVHLISLYNEEIEDNYYENNMV